MKGSVIPANVPWDYLQNCLDELDMGFGCGHAIIGTSFADPTDHRNKPLATRAVEKISQALRDRAVRETKVLILSTYKLAPGAVAYDPDRRKF